MQIPHHAGFWLLWCAAVPVLLLAWMGQATSGESSEPITLSSQRERVNALAFAPDGKQLTAACDRGVVLWDVAARQQKPVRETTAAERPAAVAFSPNGKLLASGGYDNSVRIWDAASREQRQRLDHPGVVYALAFAPDSKTLATACFDKVVRVWNVQTGAERMAFKGHTEVGSSRVDLQACKLEYSIVSPK